MKKVLSLEEARYEITHIIGAVGRAQKGNQAAEALLSIFDRVNDTDAECVVEWILAEFDPKNVKTDYKYKFPSPWSSTKLAMVLTDSEGLFQRAKEIIKESSGSIKEAAKMVTGNLKSLESDRRILFLAIVMSEGLCPYNFYVSRDGVTMEEVRDIIDTDPNIEKLFAVFGKRTGKRFLTMADEADYVLSLTEGPSRRTLVAFVIALMEWSKQMAVHRQMPLMSHMADMLDMMEEAPLPPEFMQLLMGGLAPGLHSHGGGVRIHVMRAGNIFDRATPGKGGCKDPECSCGGRSC